jgi:hypothetical protein
VRARCVCGLGARVASIPGICLPVIIDVEADGRVGDEHE